MKLLKSPISFLYIEIFLMSNFRRGCHHNYISMYFGVTPPIMEEHIPMRVIRLYPEGRTKILPDEPYARGKNFAIRHKGKLRYLGCKKATGNASSVWNRAFILEIRSTIYSNFLSSTLPAAFFLLVLYSIFLRSFISLTCFLSTKRKVFDSNATFSISISSKSSKKQRDSQNN